MKPKTRAYYAFGDYLKQKFAQRVYKITLDGGFSCPNRDGTLSKDGCVFCDEYGSFSLAHDKNLSIIKQIETGIEAQNKRFGAEKFLAYFQSFSNTYKPVDELKKIYDEAILNPKIVGLSIGTRPDCVDEEKLNLISSYKERLNDEVWVEYGLQSIHDETLKLINRGHDFKCFKKAYKTTKKRGIKVCVHVILGLLGENRQKMLETARVLSDMKIDGIKIHCLCALKGTKLASMKDFKPLDEDEYVGLVCDFLEFLPSNVTVHRLAGSGLGEILIKPLWLKRKFETLNKIDREFEKRGSFQGFRADLKH